MMDAPFLTNLGVSPLLQGRAPTAGSFPDAFNPNARTLWESVFPIVESGDPRFDWGVAIRDYIDACEVNDVYPFRETGADPNDRIFEALRDGRAAVVNFIDRIELFKEVKIRDVARTVTMMDVGFTLEVYGLCRLLDPSFPQWLIQVGFAQDQGEYHKALGGMVTMWVRKDGEDNVDRWHIGYRIKVSAYPAIPGHAAPSKSELERFVLDVLWDSAFRMNRPNGLLHRLI